MAGFGLETSGKSKRFSYGTFDGAIYLCCSYRLNWWGVIMIDSFTPNVKSYAE